ncbi:MAG TPA: hypothetical protein PL009_00930 [Flavipsychrobacter sp.]|nr:hypothetical protein [Flavipsychrobacter sp.]
MATFCLTPRYIFYFIVAAIALFFSSTSHAQNDDVNFRKFYLRAGLAMPQGHFKNAFDNNIATTDNFSKSGGLGAKSGFVFDIGSYIYMHPDPIADGIKIGLDFTFMSLTYNQLNWETDLTGSKTAPTFLTLSSKLGPLVSYNFADIAIVDVYFKVAPTFLFASETTYVRNNSDGVEMLPEDIGFGVKWNTGITFHYGVGSFTVCYDAGRVKKTVYRPNGFTMMETEEQLLLNMVQVKIGLQL